jgi:hypothetical protein
MDRRDERERERSRERHRERRVEKSPVRGLQIQWRVRLHKITHVGNVDTDFKVPIGKLTTVQGIVDIFAARRVNGDCGKVSQICSLGDNLFSDLPIALWQASHDLSCELIAWHSILVKENLRNSTVMTGGDRGAHGLTCVSTSFTPSTPKIRT